MNLLLPLGALGAYLLFKPKPSTKKTSSSSPDKKDSISDDCQWYCPGAMTNIAMGFDFSKELYKNKKFFNKHIDKYLSDDDFGIKSLTKELLKTYQWGKCKLAGDEISVNDPLTLRYAYVNALPTAAFYLALSEKITDYQLAIWLGTEYPKLLNNLGLLTPGNYSLEILTPRFDVITPEILTSALSKLYILIPEFRNIQAELVAQILTIQLSQIVEFEQKDKCFKITKMQYGDFSALSGKIDPAYQNLFGKIFDAVILANPK